MKVADGVGAPWPDPIPHSEKESYVNSQSSQSFDSIFKASVLSMLGKSS